MAKLIETHSHATGLRGRRFCDLCGGKFFTHSLPHHRKSCQKKAPQKSQTSVSGKTASGERRCRVSCMIARTVAWL